MKIIIKNLMEILVYKRDYDFFFVIACFYYINYHESV